MITTCIVILGFVAVLEVGAFFLMWNIRSRAAELRELLAMMPEKKEPTMAEMRRFFAEPAKPGDVTFHFPSILKNLD